MIPDLNHSPTAGDQWGGDNTRHAVTSKLEIRSPMLCWNNVQVESEVGNVCYQAEEVAVIIIRQASIGCVGNIETIK